MSYKKVIFIIFSIIVISFFEIIFICSLFFSIGLNALIRGGTGEIKNDIVNLYDYQDEEHNFTEQEKEIIVRCLGNVNIFEMQGIKVNENGKICISLDNKDFKHKGLVMLNMEYDEKEDIIELKNMLKLKDSSYNSSEKKYLRFYSEVGSITLDSYDLDKKIAYLTINERLPSTYNVNTIENTGNRYSLYDYLLKINLENSIKMQKEVDSEISNSIKTFCMTNIIIFLSIILFMYTAKKAKQSINKK